jgi:HPt (histidine-containing phosphotransfer) domain-containing protein
MGVTLHASKTEAFETVAKMGAIDVAFLDRVTFSDRSLAREVLVMFDQQADSLLKVIRDTESTRMRLDFAHKLKGAARGVGAFSVARAAEEIETATDEIELAHAISLLTVRVTEARMALAGLMGAGNA